ncbi:MAG TPA: class I SAM-dependent methyltransferase [Streptosporangiaceae bacterium]|nr:class I SAM-dependent methyltransferase [Streptosporangiaceae bacterium]
MATMTGAPADYRIYTDLAGWWPLISPPHEYAREAAYLAHLVGQAGPAGKDHAPEVLDLGSGGGHIALHLKHLFDLTLVDISGDMLAASRRLNPECDHRQGDMRTVRLHRTFDAVLVHDAIDYVVGVGDLRAVIETAAAHCRPGGLAIFVPDYVKDTFSELTGGGGGGVDSEGRTATFSERTWDPEPADDWVQAEYEFILRDASGDRRVVHEIHRLSAYSRGTWLAELASAGLIIEQDPSGRGRPATAPGRRPDNLFVARRPVPG